MHDLKYKALLNHRYKETYPMLHNFKKEITKNKCKSIFRKNQRIKKRIIRLIRQLKLIISF